MCLRDKVDDMARRVDKTQRDLRRGISHPGTIADLRIRPAGVRRRVPAGTKRGGTDSFEPPPSEGDYSRKDRTSTVQTKVLLCDRPP